MAEVQQADVDLAGLLEVLSSHLYSAPEVAVRELVQNAHDSITRRRIEATVEAPRIQVLAEGDGRVLRIVDNGAGLTRDEVIRYLATLGAGYTRLLRAQDSSLIGAFGLGFLTSYVVSERVVVETCSYQEPGRAWRFASRDGMKFTLDEAPPRSVGTEVRLYLREELEHLADVGTLRGLLDRYACLLEHPIEVQGMPVNEGSPPWRTPTLHPVALKRELLAWATRFDRVFEPLTASLLHGLPHGARGLFWIQAGGRWATSDNRRVTVFVRGMMVDDDARELLPEWAGFCGAVIECDALKPTASREEIQKDEVWRALQAGVGRAVVATLGSLSSADPGAWARVLRRHNEALIGAAIAEPDLREVLERSLTVPTSEGDLTLPEVQRASPRGLLVTSGDGADHEQVLYRALGRPVVDGARYGAMPFARLFADRNGLPLVVLGTERGNAELFHPVRDDQRAIGQVESEFAAPETTVVLARFAPLSLPAVLVLDRDARLKRRLDSDAADARISKGLLALAREFTDSLDDETLATLYVNYNNPAVRALLDAEPERRSAAVALIRSVASLSTRDRSDGDVGDPARALRELTDGLVRLLGVDGVGSLEEPPS